MILDCFDDIYFFTLAERQELVKFFPNFVVAFEFKFKIVDTDSDPFHYFQEFSQHVVPLFNDLFIVCAKGIITLSKLS